MNKQLKDWTLGEVKAYCEGRVCDGCVFATPHFCRLAHYHYLPKWWNLPDSPRFTEQEVEDAKTIMRLFPNALEIRRTCFSGDLILILHCAHNTEINRELFPSIKSDETVKLSDIVGGE